MQTDNLNITILGVGAIGGVIGAYLIKAGYRVTLLDVNEDHVRKMNEDGLTIKTVDDTFTVQATAYTVDGFKKKNEKLDIVLLAVKAQHTEAAVKSISDLLAEDGFIVSFQNGLNEEIIAEEVGRERTVGCFVNLFADYLEPGVISYGGVGSLYIGEVDGEDSERVNQLVRALQNWGEAKKTNNIFGYLWSKLAYGTILTATATSNITIADFIASEKYRPLVMALGKEVLQVADKKGIKPEFFDDWEPTYVFPELQEDKLNEQFEILENRLRGYTKTRTGIWRDLAVRKRKTEVPQQLNPIIAEGEKQGFSMTLLKTLLELITEIEDGKREMSEDNLQVLIDKI
ncbi:ketopantoate reductase family protein [Oceanobacillus alkalisoli]|uniref:ketopantoate reductase family protein n=1 Tax=Oceanobacillus alkalisoli TaxID=2925113 RepID=UPI001EE3B773|nr:2-dehydropantoate 2-reductase [Oceanobacillus alkalisoli]MCG5105381.1 2-dehydropantoate 2-reductase [Oceanobacillus alkalisoli]